MMKTLHPEIFLKHNDIVLKQWLIQLYNLYVENYLINRNCL